jgi:hypothetical protein
MPPSPDRPTVPRLIAGYGAIACALPYLALKLVWLSGGTLGVADQRMMRDSSMIALNAITAGMDVVGVMIALAFTHRWGLRMPAWLVLPPIWVASGLLAKFVVEVPVVVIARTLGPASASRVVGGPVQPWVYAVVYPGFTGLGIGLIFAFVLYARTRWPWAFQSTTGDAPSGPTHAVQAPLASAAALMAIAVGGLHAAWALGATVGLGPELVARRTISSRLINGIDGALMLAGAVGVLMLVHRLGRRAPSWLPLVLAWVGGGSLFSWGLWHMILVLPNTALVRDRPGEMALPNVLGLVRLLAGLVVGLVTLFLLAERSPTPGRR